MHTRITNYQPNQTSYRPNQIHQVNRSSKTLPFYAAAPEIQQRTLAVISVSANVTVLTVPACLKPNSKLKPHPDPPSEFNIICTGH